MHLRDTAYNCVHDYPGGAASLAPRMAKSATTLAHELNGTGAAKLGLLDAEKITQLTGDLRILEAFAGNCGQMLVPLPDTLRPGSEKDCMLRLADTAREFGELCCEVSGCMADGRVSDNELSRIDRECGELVASVHALREALARRNVESKPRAE